MFSPNGTLSAEIDQISAFSSVTAIVTGIVPPSKGFLYESLFSCSASYHQKETARLLKWDELNEVNNDKISPKTMVFSAEQNLP